MYTMYFTIFQKFCQIPNDLHSDDGESTQHFEYQGVMFMWKSSNQTSKRLEHNNLSFSKIPQIYSSIM